MSRNLISGTHLSIWLYVSPEPAPKIILDSKKLTRISTTGTLSVAANTALDIYGSLIKAVPDACAVKDSKNNTKNVNEKNNNVSTSSQAS